MTMLSTYAQSRYYTMEECNNDTLKYIEKNYEQNKARYIGKTIQFWADECQIKLGDVVPGEFSPWGKDKSLIGKVENISFDIPFSESSNYYEYTIYLYIESPYTLNWDEAADLGGDYTATWGAKTYYFYKDQKIKDIYIKRRMGSIPESV